MLRNIPLIKIFLIAYVWAAVTAFSPLVETGLEVSVLLGNKRYLLLFAERIIFILAITIPFDIRDFDQDREHSLVTIPSLAGTRVSKMFSIFLLLIYVLITIKLYGKGMEMLVLLLSGILASILILRSRKELPDIYFTGLIDGLLVLQPILILLLRWL